MLRQICPLEGFQLTPHIFDACESIPFQTKSMAFDAEYLLNLNQVTPKYFVISNVGDSRAIVCRDGESFFNTKDQKPDDDREKTRIEKAGGWVVSGRICRCLAVARALGDHTFKEDPKLLPEEQMLTAIPDVVCVMTLRPSVGGCGRCLFTAALSMCLHSHVQ